MKMGGCRTLKTLKSDQAVALKTLKNKYFSVENLEMRVYYRESFESPIFVSENLLIFKFVLKFLNLIQINTVYTWSGQGSSLIWVTKITKSTILIYTDLRMVATILDINYVDFLQFQRYFTPQAELEEAFIYIIHKPIDFSCRLKT